MKGRLMPAFFIWLNDYFRLSLYPAGLASWP